jgi:hypothetical protein
MSKGILFILKKSFTWVRPKKKIQTINEIQYIHEYDVHHVREDQSIFDPCITSTPNTTFNQDQSTSLNCYESKYSVLDASQSQDVLTDLIQKNIEISNMLQQQLIYLKNLKI